MTKNPAEVVVKSYGAGWISVDYGYLPKSPLPTARTVELDHLFVLNLEPHFPSTTSTFMSHLFYISELSSLAATLPKMSFNSTEGTEREGLFRSPVENTWISIISAPIQRSDNN